MYISVESSTIVNRVALYATKALVIEFACMPINISRVHNKCFYSNFVRRYNLMKHNGY